MSFETYLIFFFTTMVVVFTPGAAALAVAAQGASNGLRRALFGVVGVASANVVYFVFSATGIASILIASNMMFAIIKWIGVAYLLYLGFTILFRKQGAIRITPDKGSSRGRGLFVHGFIVEAANPKALLYFAAILPQFVDISQPVLAQFLLMGVTTVVLDLASYSIYAALGNRLVRGGVKDWVIWLVNKTAGVALVFAGIKMASVEAAKLG